MKRAILLVFASFLGASAFASSDWKGKVVDENGEPVPYAYVAVLSAADSSIIAGTSTLENGTFTIPGEGKKHLLMVSMIGYKSLFISVSDCNTITLTPDPESIEGAVVSAVIPKTTLTGEGLQTSVRGTVLETVGTANDVLARTPGIIKTEDGLQVLGKGAPLVYINGRKVSDLGELDRLQSNEIQSVEVITNPGAQYSASVRSVVRIRTVKHQGDGFGFNTGLRDEQSLRNGYNDPSMYLNMNFRHNGLDLFAGSTVAKNSYRQESDMLQQTFGTPEFKQEGTLDNVSKITNSDLNGGFNYQISNNHSLGARVDAYLYPKSDSHQIVDEDIFVSGVLTDHLTSEGYHNIEQMPYGLSANAYYNGRVGRLGIDFNADYFGLRSSQASHTVETSAEGNNADVNYLSHSGNRMYAGKLVLSYPVWIGMLQAGTEDVFSRREDDYTISNVAVPPSASEVREDNIALFASYGMYLSKLGQLSAGVRYEHVSYAYDDLVGSDDLSRKYDNVFPTLAYGGVFGPVQMQLSYSAKTRRPNFEALSSAVMYHSRYMYQSGNARLQPQTNHDLGLNLNWRWLTGIAQYSRVDDALTQWSELYNSEGVIIVHPVNLDTPLRTLSCFVNASPTVGAWSLNYTVGLLGQWLEMDVADPREESGMRHVSFSHKPMLYAKLFNVWRLKGDWQLEFGGEYHSRAYSENALITSSFLDITAAVQKELFGRSLVLRLEGGDLAGLGHSDAMIDSGSHLISQKNIFDSQRVKFSVRYNFNTAQSKYKGTGAGGDVKERMK